jgi:DMSO/TMAO reductase YedYZ molybdopterin-dependent catalytic subunit
MALVSPGLSGRRGTADGKLPPGQYLTVGFPVLSAGPSPQVPLEKWELSIEEGSEVLRRRDWKSLCSLPAETFTADLHCVTRWSKLGTTWEGVSLDTLFAGVKTDAAYALVYSYGDYTIEVPPAVCLGVPLAIRSVHARSLLRRTRRDESRSRLNGWPLRRAGPGGPAASTLR